MQKPDTNATNATNDTNDTNATNATGDAAAPEKERKPRVKRTLDERVSETIAGAKRRYETLCKREASLSNELEQVRTERRSVAGELRKYGADVEDAPPSVRAAE